MTTNASRPIRIWLGVIPKDMTDAGEIEAYVRHLTRRKWINLAYNRIEIVEEEYGIFRSRSVFAIRRPAENVIDSLLQRKELMYSLETVMPLVIEILREAPGRSFGSFSPGASACQYWDYAQDCPDCVVGRLLARLGADVKNLIPIYANQDKFKFLASVATLFEPSAREFVASIQNTQDTGILWGDIAEMIERNEVPCQ